MANIVNFIPTTGSTLTAEESAWISKVLQEHFECGRSFSKNLLSKENVATVIVMLLEGEFIDPFLIARPTQYYEITQSIPKDDMLPSIVAMIETAPERFVPILDEYLDWAKRSYGLTQNKGTGFHGQKATDAFMNEYEV